MKYMTSTDECFFTQEYEAETPAAAASYHASEYGVEPGELIWVAWGREPNNDYDPEQPVDEWNPEFWLMQTARPFRVLDDDGAVENTR